MLFGVARSSDTRLTGPLRELWIDTIVDGGRAVL